MPRTKKTQTQPTFLLSEADLRTAICVPAIRSEVGQWLESPNYPGVTDTTRTLLNYWFHTDHRLRDAARTPFSYHASQRRALETLIWLYEVKGISNLQQMVTSFAQKGQHPRLLKYDLYPRYAVKMATGSGKTVVMALSVLWHYFNAVRETENPYASTFLVVAPNVIVFERLLRDFRGGAVFDRLRMVPGTLESYWDLECYVRGDGPRAHSEGALFLTNIQQLYDRAHRGSSEPSPMAGVLGPVPRPGGNGPGDDFAGRIAERGRPVLVLNDEAHHTHNEESKWMQAIRALDQKASLASQLDFTATPRFNDGTLFPWTAYDYPLARAIEDDIVKRPTKGIVVDFEEAQSDYAPTQYSGYLVAGVERWKEYRDQLAEVGKKPILFIMLSSTNEVDDVADWLRKQYPSEFGTDKTLAIHVNLRANEDDDGGGIVAKDLVAARKFAEEVDTDTSPVNAVVSVMMLREGWDVQNVTVVVGLRPYSAKADILPEQTIGRGLRLMFRGREGFEERVDIIGNKRFLDFIDDLEKQEGVAFGTFDPAKERLSLITIAPVPGRELRDIGVPELSRVLQRRQDLGAVIADLDLSGLVFTPLRKADKTSAETMRFEAYDALTEDLVAERSYERPQPQMPQEVIHYYADAIGRRVKAPGHWAAIALKLREFFDNYAFGGPVDLDEAGYLQGMVTKQAGVLVPDLFVNALRPFLIKEEEPTVQAPARSLYTTPPFLWSRPTYDAEKSVFNLQPCDNNFEREFARWLEHASDCTAFAKLPRQFAFSIEYADAAGNLRLYYPDFVALDTASTHWLMETKGQEDLNVTLKDQAAALWCRNATELGVGNWRYVKVPQKEFERIAPGSLPDLDLLTPKPPGLTHGGEGITIT